MRATTRIKHYIIIILRDKDDMIGLMCQYTNNIGVRQYCVHGNDNNKNNEAKNKKNHTPRRYTETGLYCLIELKYNLCLIYLCHIIILL